MLNLDSNRVPPQNTEAEQTVLGSAMLNKDAAFAVVSKLNEEDFYKPSHQCIFRSIYEVHSMNDSVDIVTVSNRLKENNHLDQVGGPAYISMLTDLVPVGSGAESYCRIIKNKSVLRRLILKSSEIAERCYSGEGKHDTLMADVEQIIYDAQENTKSDGFTHISKILPSVLDTIAAMSKGDKKYFGMETGYGQLDRALSGFCEPDLIIIAGRPSMGKTALAMNIIENTTSRGEKAAIFSMEMADSGLAVRLISSVARIDSFKMRNGRVSDMDWPRITHACEKLNNMGIFIDDSSALSINEMRSRARRLKAKENISAIYVDYLQLGKAEAGNREGEISEISRGLKAMAKELRIPVIALAQLNRGLESRTNKRPVLSDLRESGAIEQDADVILFIYRDEVYDKSPANPNKGIAEIIIGKQRNGPTGTVELVWKEDYTRFESKITMHEPVN